jgi:hypothetical protein
MKRLETLRKQLAALDPNRACVISALLDFTDDPEIAVNTLEMILDAARADLRDELGKYHRPDRKRTTE